MAATQPLVDSLVDFPTPAALWEKLNRDWLTGHGHGNAQINQQWFANVEARCHQLQQHEPQTLLNKTRCETAPETGNRPLLLIAEPEPLDFLASFWAALLSKWDMALANPNWGDREFDSAIDILQPSLVWAASERPSLSNFSDGRTAVRPYRVGIHQKSSLGVSAILVPTGGTSGKLKFAYHTWTTLLTAATSFCQTFPTPVHTYCVLPVHHVSGLMQLLRAWISQAQVMIAPFKTLETYPALIDSPTGWYISLVPTQLSRLIAARKGSWLSQFQAVLLGGAPPWPDLLAQAAERKIPICLSYGMTETAAMVTVKRPKAMATPLHRRIPPDTQASNGGSPLPHAKITIEVNGQRQPPNTIGQVVIHSQAIARGYYNSNSANSNSANNSAFSPQIFHTDDLGYLTPQGQLHITGRASSKIISGGENIFPAEVEAALHSTGQIKDVHVFSQPDPQWGEAVVAAFVPARPNVSASSLKSALSDGKTGPLLSRYKHPKRWIQLDTIPRNAQGKILKSALIAKTKLSQSQLP